MELTLNLGMSSLNLANVFQFFENSKFTVFFSLNQR